MNEPAEFSAIRRHFGGADRGEGVLLGIGDDAAVLSVPAGERLVVTTDAMIAGTHFPQDAPGEDIGYRALAVNLSDLAAMGATPRWALLALAMPTLDDAWLAAFARGFRALAAQYAVALVGGNLSRGALSATVQLAGTVPSGAWLARSGGRAGDRLLVSGTLGDAAAGLARWQAGSQRTGTDGTTIVGSPGAGGEGADFLRRRYLRPEARVALGREALGCASAAIDLSDGLLPDLRHLCRASGMGAQLELDRLPLSSALRAAVPQERAEELALAGGDDYELLLAVPPRHTRRLCAAAQRIGVALTDIGGLTAGGGVTATRAGQAVELSASGFEHFGRSPG